MTKAVGGLWAAVAVPCFLVSARRSPEGALAPTRRERPMGPNMQDRKYYLTFYLLLLTFSVLFFRFR